MRRLRIPNPLLDKNYKTYLASDYSSGTSATVLNNNSFAASDLGVFGEPTEELTELKKIDAISGSTILTLASALNFAHQKETPIYKSLWDNVSIEGRSSSAGTFAELTQSGLQWDNKKGETVYFHASGDDNWQYRYRFYNSVTATYSEYSPTLTGAGFSRDQVGYMIRTVRKVTNCPDQTVVTDDEIIRQFNRGQDIIYAHNPKYWFLYVDTYKGSNPVSCTADSNVYTLASYTTLGHLASVRYRYNSGGTDKLYHLSKKSDTEFDHIVSDLNDSNDDWAECYKLLPADASSDEGYIQIYPTTKTTGVGRLYPNYYEKMADLDDVADETQVIMPEILEDFAIGYVFRVKGDETRAKVYESGLISDSEDKVPRHLQLLDKMDRSQKAAQQQPRSLWNFKGQRAVQRIYGNARHSMDYIKESGIYDDWR